jgi:spermidine synthase
MNIAKDGWFTELGSMWPGQGLSLKVKEVLYKGKSKFQVTHSHQLCPLTISLDTFWMIAVASSEQRGQVQGLGTSLVAAVWKRARRALPRLGVSLLACQRHF